MTFIGHKSHAFVMYYTYNKRIILDVHFYIGLLHFLLYVVVCYVGPVLKLGLQLKIILTIVFSANHHSLWTRLKLSRTQVGVFTCLTRSSKHKYIEFTMKFEKEKQQIPLLFCLAFLTVLIWKKKMKCLFNSRYSFTLFFSFSWD